MIKKLSVFCLALTYSMAALADSITPATNSITPTASSTTPTANLTTPTASSTTPAANLTIPTASSTTTPAENLTIPTASSTTPPANLTIPTASSTTPTANLTTATASSTTTPAVDADKNKFSIDYGKDSPIKEVPLKNTTLKIKVWYNGNPNGEMEVTTDENQNFTLAQFKDSTAVALEILSIADQDKYNASCGNTQGSGDQKKIMIMCKKYSKK